MVDSHKKLSLTNSTFRKTTVSFYELKVNLTRGIPMFFDSTIDGGTDPLIDFHNKLNQNLFQKKNIKLLRRFYETEPIQTEAKHPNKHDMKSTKETERQREASDDPFEEANKKYEAKRGNRHLPLSEEKTDYILEQRANAISEMTEKLHNIATRYPLSRKIMARPAKKKFQIKTTRFDPVGEKLSTTRSKTFYKDPNVMNQTLNLNTKLDRYSSSGRVGPLPSQGFLNATKTSSIGGDSLIKRDRTQRSEIGVGHI